MSRRPSLHSGHDSEESFHNLKYLSQVLKSPKLWRQQEAKQKIKKIKLKERLNLPY